MSTATAPTVAPAGVTADWTGDKLPAAHFADAIDLPTPKRHEDRIRAGLADVNRKLATTQDKRRRLGLDLPSQTHFLVVEPAGLEPATSRLQSECSPS